MNTTQSVTGLLKMGYGGETISRGLTGVGTGFGRMLHLGGCRLGLAKMLFTPCHVRIMGDTW